MKELQDKAPAKNFMHHQDTKEERSGVKASKKIGGEMPVSTPFWSLASCLCPRVLRGECLHPDSTKGTLKIVRAKQPGAIIREKY